MPTDAGKRPAIDAAAYRAWRAEKQHAVRAEAVAVLRIVEGGSE